MANGRAGPCTNYQLYNLNHDAELPSLPYSIGGSFRRYGWLAGINVAREDFFAKCDRNFYVVPQDSTGEDSMSISPLRNLNKKGGAFAIMLSQFRRALGVTIVRDMANHKLSRLHYVRATARRC